MFLKNSRYQEARPFAADEDGREISGVRPRPIGPATGVIEHVIQEGDRLDLLARHYYNDDRLWWRILDANPEFVSGDDLLAPGREGAVILVPRAREG